MQDYCARCCVNNSLLEVNHHENKKKMTKTKSVANVILSILWNFQNMSINKKSQKCTTKSKNSPNLNIAMLYKKQLQLQHYRYIYITRTIAHTRGHRRLVFAELRAEQSNDSKVDRNCPFTIHCKFFFFYFVSSHKTNQLP